MVTAYSPILKLALPVQGELSGTWGDVVNDNITSMVEQAIAGRAVIDTWTTDSHTLTTANGTTSESRCAMLELTDTGVALTGAGTVICPAASKIYIVKNASGQNITVKTSAGTGILVPNGRTTFLFCDGTNVVEAMTHTTSLQLGTSTVVTAVLDEDNMASDSATSLATQQSIKAYVDAQVGANNELSEVLANGNTSGANDIIVDSGQKITTNTIDETTAGSGVTIDSVLLKDDVVNATDVETGSISANDGTTAATIANATGVITVPSAVLTTADINGGTADGVVIGGTTPAAATVTTATANTSLTIAGTTTVTSILDEDNMASDDPAGLATQQSIKAYVDAQVGANNELSEVLANGNTTGGTDIAVSTGDDITFADSSKAIFGAGSDLQIYHNGTQSFIEDTGTGSLFLRSGSNVYIQNAGGTANYFKGTDGGASELFHNGSIKLSTTSTGVAVTGTVTADGLTVDGDVRLDGGASGSDRYLRFTEVFSSIQNAGFYFHLDGTDDDLYIGRHDTADTNVANDKPVIGIDRGTGDISFYNSAGTSAQMVWDASAESLGIGRSSPDDKLHVYSSSSLDHIKVDGPAGINRNINFATAGSTRWNIYANSSVESGSNAGSNLSFARYTDAGAFISTAMLIERSSGNVGIGTSLPTDKLTISSGSNQIGLDTGNQATFGTLDLGHFPNGAFIGTQAGTNAASNLLRFGTSGIERLRIAASGALITKGAAVFNEDGANADFRVESDGNTHMLFVDASSNYVGIGHSAPSTIFDVKSSEAVVSTLRGTTSSIAYLDITNYATSAAGVGAGVEFRANTSAQERQVGFITASYTDATDATRDSRMDFHININGGTTRALELGADEITINEGGQNTDFRVESDSNANMLFVDGGNNKVIVGSSNIPNINGSSPRVYELVLPTGVSIGDSNFTHGYIGNAGTDGNIEIVANAYPANLAAERYVYIKTGSAGGGGPNLLATFANGIGSVFNDDGASGKDFRVESDNQSNMFFINAGTDQILINDAENKGTGPMVIRQDTNYQTTDMDNEPTLYLQNETNVDTYGGSVIVLEGNNSSGSSYRTAIRGGQAGLHLYGSANNVTAANHGELKISQSGTSSPGDVIINEGSSSDTDFRVESDTNTHALFVDASLNSIGIGRSTPNIVANAQGDTSMNVAGVLSVHGTLASHQTNALIFERNGNISSARAYGATAGDGIFSIQVGGGGGSADSEVARFEPSTVTINELSNNIDFRVESDSNGSMFFIDASQNTVNINNNTAYANTTFLMNQTGDNKGLTLANTSRGTSRIDWELSGITNGGMSFLHNNNTARQNLLYMSRDEAVFNTGGENTDFRVESDTNSHALFVDGGNNQVVIASSVGTGVSGLSDGYLVINQGNTARNGMVIYNQGENYSAYTVKASNNTGTRYFGYWVNSSANNVGSISYTSSSSSFNTTSDYRLKENVVNLSGATERLKQLQPKRFNFIIDPDKTVDGFIAHEAATVVPEAVIGEKDAVNDDGSISPQGIDNSKLVPLLVATIKELEARITALENA